MSRHGLRTGLGVVLAIVALAGRPAGAATWITGYYAAYSESQPGVNMAPGDFDYSILTHVIHWPVVPRNDGTFDPDQLGLTAAQSEALLARARAAGIKAILGFGGDVASVGDGWRGATSTANRASFVAAIVSLMQARGYDGVDINWEGLSAADPLDQAQFPAFIQQLRAALDEISPRPLLTMPPVTGSEAPIALVAQVASAFDQINLQTYVMSGPYPGWVTWFNSPLLSGDFTFPSTGEKVPSADQEVDRYQAAGVPLSQMAIGIQFDGFVWSGGSGTDTGGVSAPRQAWTLGDGQQTDPGAPSVALVRTADILASFTEADGFQRTFDDVARVPWLGRDLPGSADDRFISFDDEQAIQEKAAYVTQKGLGGIFVFELAGDFFPNAQGDARHPLLAALRRAGPPQPTNPTLSVELNRGSFGPGETVSLTATLTPGTSPDPVDAYVVVRLPDATFLSLALGGGTVPGIVPIVRSFAPAPFSGELLRYTFTGAEPTGDYTVLSGLARPGTLDPIGGVVEEDHLTFGTLMPGKAPRRSGSGSIDDRGSAPLGLGNLILGFNAPPDGLLDGERSGSPTLVIGDGHRPLGLGGGLVAGTGNTASAPYASVSGGPSNTANGLVVQHQRGRSEHGQRAFRQCRRRQVDTPRGRWWCWTGTGPPS